MKYFLESYWQFIKKYKFIAAVILVLTLVAIGLFVLKGQEPQPLPSPTPAPLVLRHVSPKPPEFKSIWSTEPIVFTFNKALDLETIKVTVTPNTQVNVKKNPDIPNQFSVVPLRGWEANQEYKITVSQSLKAADGGTLSSDLNINFKRLFDPSDLEEIPNEHPGE